MEPGENKKNKGGRPRQAEKEDIIITVRCNKSDHFILTQKAKKAGFRISTYILGMAVKGTVKARMTEEERQHVRKLVGMANNLNQLAKKFHEAGIISTVQHFESLRGEIDELIKQLKNDQ